MAAFVNKIDPLQRNPDRPIPDFAVFDIEANYWKELVVVGHYDGKKFSHFGTMLEYLIWLTDIREDGSIPDDLTLFAHNGGCYDFNFVLQCIIREEGRKYFRIKNVLPRGSSFLCIEIQRIYKSKWQTEEGPTLTLRDSLAFLPFSLRQLTDSFKTECAKGEWDHDNVVKTRDDPLLLEYLRGDCVGLYQVLEKYFNWPLIKQSGVKYTIASQALAVFRTTLKDRIVGCGGKVDEFVRKAYFGGRTEVFKPYFISNNETYFDEKLLNEKPDEWEKLIQKSEDKISCWDVNSLYPSVMRDFEYPTTFKKWTHKYDPNSFGFWEAEVEVPKDMYVPPLGTLIHIDRETKEVTKVSDSSQGKLIFPTGKFSGVWTTIELEYARSIGVKIVRTGRGAIFENGGYIFKDFINELYEMRLKAEKDSVDSFICKLIMNSSYGRFGLNLDRESLVIDEGQEGVTESAYEFETGEVIDGKPVMFRFVKEKKRIQSFTNVAIAAWVTALARIRMHKQYMKYQSNLYYTDTDSIFVKHDSSMPDSKLLGEFKYEYSAMEGCFLLPKTYALAGITGLKDKKGQYVRAKAVIKGINKEAMKMRKVTVNDLHNLLEGDFKRSSVGPIDPTAIGRLPIPEELGLEENQKTERKPLIFDIKPKFAKVKTAMRKGTFLYVQEASKKEVKARYDKRTIVYKPDGTYDTVPIHIEGGFAPNYRAGEIQVVVKKKKGKKTFEIKNLDPEMVELEKNLRKRGLVD